MRVVRCPQALLAAFLLAIPCAAPAASEPSIAALLAAPDRFDNQAVTETGIVARYESRTSRRGSPYVVLMLCQDACLTVFVPERLALNEGDAVSVHGVFLKDVRAGTALIHNEIKAEAASDVRNVRF